MIRAIVISGLLVLTACGGKAKPVSKMAASNARLGECADPRKAGVLSASPDLRSAHRDLNKDGRLESVFADKNLCKAGNCSWNLFTKDEGCSRYIGTVSGSTLEVVDVQGDAGFLGLRVWWRLGKGTRQLVQNYRYQEGGYQLMDVLICRLGGDGRLQCASEEQVSN